MNICLVITLILVVTIFVYDGGVVSRKWLRANFSIWFFLNDAFFHLTIPSLCYDISAGT